MRILTIIGTPHKGNTRAITDLFLDEFKGEDTIFDEIVLPNDFNYFCYGCFNCILKGEDKCPHYNYVNPIVDKLEKADLIIISTPIFVMSCTSGLKSLLDHLAYIWMVHRPKEVMFNKVGLIITTAGGSGVKSTIKLIKNNLSFWGVSKIYNYGVTTMKMGGNYIDYENKDKIKRQIKSKAKRIKKSLNNNKISIKTKFLFKVFKASQKNGWNETDYNYWKEKGWIKK